MRKGWIIKESHQRSNLGREQRDSDGEGSQPRKVRNGHNSSQVKGTNNISAQEPKTINISQDVNVEANGIEVEQAVTNEALNNSGMPVIIVEPEDAEGFFSSTVAVYRFINNSLIGKSSILDCTRNLQKKIYVIKVKSNRYLKDILKMTQLGDFKIKCSSPATMTQKAAVTGPFGTNTKPEKIQEELIMWLS